MHRFLQRIIDAPELMQLSARHASVRFCPDAQSGEWEAYANGFIDGYHSEVN